MYQEIYKLEAYFIFSAILHVSSNF